MNVNKDFTILPNKYVRDSEVKGTDLLVLINLISRAGKNKSCFPSYSRIACDIGVSKSTVKRSVKRLAEAGMIIYSSSKNEHGGNSSNTYVIKAIEGLSTSYPQSYAQSDAQKLQRQLNDWGDLGCINL